jgi:uncharacterized protein (UPF0261 family)
MKTVLLIGTLDTKGAEYAFIRDLIQARGVETLVMDLGTVGSCVSGRCRGGCREERRLIARCFADAAIAVKQST